MRVSDHTIYYLTTYMFEIDFSDPNDVAKIIPDQIDENPYYNSLLACGVITDEDVRKVLILFINMQHDNNQIVGSSVVDPDFAKTLLKYKIIPPITDGSFIKELISLYNEKYWMTELFESFGFINK